MIVKVLMISNMYPSTLNPVNGIFVKNFENGLISNGVDVQRVVLTRAKKGGMKRFMGYMNFYYKIYKEVRGGIYDVIYVHYLTHSLMPFIFLRKFIKNLFIVNAHGHDLVPKNIYDKILSMLTAPVVKNANAVVVPSNFFKNIVIRKKLNNNIFVSPSGGVLKVRDYDKNKVIKDFRSDQLRIGYASRIVKEKGWNVLIDSIMMIKDRYPEIDLKVYMMGGGSDVNKMIDLISKKKISDIIVYKGVLSQYEMYEVMKDVDIFVFPTLYMESLGLVGVEAMANALPVIGSNIGGLLDYIKNEYNGYLFDAGDKVDLMNKIIKYYNLTLSKKNEMAINAYRTAMDYESTVVSMEMYNFIEKCYNAKK